NFLSVISGRPQDRDVVNDCWTDFWMRLGRQMAESRHTGSNEDPHDIMQRVDIEKMNEVRAHISAVVKDPQTAAALTPWYNYLCKRPLFSDDFLQAFNQENVTLVDTDGRGVEAITESGIIAAGREYAVDCII